MWVTEVFFADGSIGGSVHIAAISATWQICCTNQLQNYSIKQQICATRHQRSYGA